MNQIITPKKLTMWNFSWQICLIYSMLNFLLLFQLIMNPQSHDVRLQKCQVPTWARFSYLISPFVFLWVWPAVCAQLEGICVCIVFVTVGTCWDLGVCVCYLWWRSFGDMHFAVWPGSGELSRGWILTCCPVWLQACSMRGRPKCVDRPHFAPPPFPLTACCLKANHTPFLFHPIEGSRLLLAWTQWLTGYVAND